MPIYEYRCKNCSKVHEIEHRLTDARPTKCPACGGELARVFHPVGVVFKGSGFHRTDYAAKSGSGAGESGAAKTTQSQPGSKSTDTKAAGEAAKPADDKKTSDPKK